MSEHPNSNYYAERALEERRMMGAATDPRALASHAELAARYEALAAYPSLVLSTLRGAAGQAELRPTFRMEECAPPISATA